MTVPERKCPGCRRSFRPVGGDPWRPFCSERCQLIDLGAWFSERHAIPGQDTDEDGQSPGVAPAGEDST